MATDMGHINNTRQHTHSDNSPDNDSSMNPTQENLKENDIFCFTVIANVQERTLYTDLTGKFPVRSYSGMQYIFLAYDYKTNSILVRAIKN